MKAELIAVGTELLLGEIANTDAQMISQKLSELGIDVYYHSVVGDNPQRLSSLLELAKNRSDIIITTGGLGPTADDLTKETIAKAFGKRLYMDSDQLTRLKARMGDKMTPNNEKQAVLPEGCAVLENDWGTAPGCAFESDGTHVIMLPGPPRECKPMMEQRAVPYLQRVCKSSVIYSDYIKVFGIGESAMEHMLTPYFNTLTNVTAAPYAKEGECEVRVTAKADSLEQAKALCTPVTHEICGILGDNVYGINKASLEQVVVENLIAKGKTIALAESCTGGLVSKRITDVAGSSQCFGYGAVTYSNEAKIKLLGVKAETLEKYGAVSEQVAREMARGVRTLSGADIGVAITGVAGPSGASEQKPVGLIYIALSSDLGEQVQNPVRTYKDDRARNRSYSATTALDMVRRLLGRL